MIYDRAREANPRVGETWGYVLLDDLKLEVIEFGPRGIPGLEDGHLLVWKLHRIPGGGKGPFSYVDSGSADTAADAWRTVCERAEVAER